MSKKMGSGKRLIGFLMVLISCAFMFQIMNSPVAVGGDDPTITDPPVKSPSDAPDTTSTDTLTEQNASGAESTSLLEVILEVLPILY